MRCRGGDAVREERGKPPSEREIGAQMLHAAKDRGVMCDDHVRSAFDCLCDDGVVHVERDEDALHLLREAADKQSCVVPVLRQMARCDAFECVHDDLTAEHV